MNKEKLVGDVINDCSNHEMMELKILRGAQGLEGISSDLASP